MSSQEQIERTLKERFPRQCETIRVPRPRRIFLETQYVEFEELLCFAKCSLEFSQLCAITGLDEGENIGLIYHLARRDGITLNIKTWVSKETPQVKTVTAIFPVAEIYEREIVDLLGVDVIGLPEGKNRYPLPDSWPAGVYPLRKDCRLEQLDELMAKQR